VGAQRGAAATGDKLIQVMLHFTPSWEARFFALGWHVESAHAAVSRAPSGRTTVVPAASSNISRIRADSGGKLKLYLPRVKAESGRKMLWQKAGNKVDLRLPAPVGEGQARVLAAIVPGAYPLVLVVPDAEAERGRDE